MDEIKINPLGLEDTSHIDYNCINKLFRLEYLYDIFGILTKLIHCNRDKPANYNINIKNTNNKCAMRYTNNAYFSIILKQELYCIMIKNFLKLLLKKRNEYEHRLHPDVLERCDLFFKNICRMINANKKIHSINRQILTILFNFTRNHTTYDMNTVLNDELDFIPLEEYDNVSDED